MNCTVYSHSNSIFGSYKSHENISSLLLYTIERAKLNSVSSIIKTLYDDYIWCGYLGKGWGIFKNKTSFFLYQKKVQLDLKLLEDIACFFLHTLHLHLLFVIASVSVSRRV